MIRINLLGQARPRAARRPVDTGAALPLVFVRTGAQELLDEIASTVSRTENLWLITMTRKGNNLSMEGASASMNSVANFITALKRSGYFQKVEIKETKQDDKSSGIQTFVFQMTAEIVPPQVAPVAPQAQRPKTVGSPAAAATPAKKG